MRSIADQSTADLGGPWSVLVRQKRDHVRLEALLTELEEAQGVEEEQVVHRLARLVFPHAFAEESVLWPVVRRDLPDGQALTLQVEREHQEVNELWSRLESGGLPPEERRRVVERLAQVLRADVRDEEDRLLPRLQQRLDARRLRRLGLAWEAVRRTAPTRPHPVVSRRPPGNALAALPLTVLDHSRDLVDAVGRRASAGPAGRFRAASQALGAVARRTERLGAFRAGEDPSTRRR
jgi:hypothetical protein